MRELRRIAFILDDFPTPSPAQQLLDRFLMGYPRDGDFHRPQNLEVTVHIASTRERSLLGRRPADFKLVEKANISQAVGGADAVIVVAAGGGDHPNDELLRTTLESSPSGIPCFVHGVLGTNLTQAQELLHLAGSHKIALLAGSPLALTWRLPHFDLPRGTHLTEALILVQGPRSLAELQAFEGLAPILEQRRGGELGIKTARLLGGAEVWAAGDRGLWSWELLAAALARSDSPQGDPALDGRTQDLAGLGLVKHLVPDPRGWLIEHQDGLRTTILVLDGLTKDFNFAVRSKKQPPFSAQLYRAPLPGEQHFSLLTAAIEDFFRTGRRPWHEKRDLLMADFRGRIG